MKKLYNLIKPEELKKEDLKRPKLRLPEGYTTFKDSNARFIPHIEAMRYLTSRGITEEIIEKFTSGPERALGLQGQSVGEGAHVSIFNPESNTEFTSATWISKSKNSPVIGMSLRGNVY